MRLHTRQSDPYQRRGFALVLSLLLVVLLSTAGVGLAMLVSTETVRADHVALDLDHRLGVESLLTYLPLLLNAPDQQARRSNSEQTKSVELTVGVCRVRAWVRSENDKLNVGGRSGQNPDPARLRQLARDNGLPMESVVLRPVVQTDDTRGWPEYLWFDQIIRPTEFEEVFHWRVPEVNEPEVGQRRKVWSDLVTFWMARGDVSALEVVTSIGADVRRWYVVVGVSEGKSNVLYQGAV